MKETWELLLTDLNFTDHIKIIAQKANNVLGIIQHTFTCRDANIILKSPPPTCV